MWRASDALERAIDRDPYHVVGYRGYATQDRALVLGRVLQNEGIAPAHSAHSGWRNLIEALKRIESDPLPFARVRARLHGAMRELVADDEGFFQEWIAAPALLSSGAWHPVELELAAPRAVARDRARPCSLVGRCLRRGE